MIKVNELKGLRSLKPLRVFHTLMLGLKMLPSYAHETYEEFYARVDKMTDEDKERIIREAILFVDIEEIELESIIGFCSDKNGIPYSYANSGNIKAEELFEIVVAICKAVAKLKIDFINEAEKKN